MKLDQYIKDLLIEKDSIIIKDFGAFEKVLQSAEIDETSGEIKPPHVTLKFDPSLKIDSGTLSKFIAEKEKISKEEAEKKIAESISIWNAELKEGKSIHLAGIGLIKQSTNGVCTFEPQIEQGTFPDMYGLPVITVEKPEPVNPRKAPIRKEPPKKKETEKKNEVEKNANIKKEPVKKAQKKPIKKKNTAHEKTMTKEESEKAKKKLLLILLIGIPIIIIVVFAALNFDTVKDKFNSASKYVSSLISGEESEDTIPDEQIAQDTSQQIAEADFTESTSNDENAQTEKVLENYTLIDGETNQTVSASETVNETYKVEIIAGSFKRIYNAKRYRNVLNKKGFSAKVLSKSNGLYRVSVGSYNDLKEASNEIENIHEIDPSLNVWILLNK